ncbi:hypothetical protein PLESTB_001896000 [Pleodorina starrii]|uniref:PsbP C-terminal domain-containing protein n=1 Tax=Pleodorina starrii TaxID=330485 RepID=A0A9W6C3P1_9CHLO|nr:hypothetical protein PLESTB_001896000 [Pleodorina starrii]GLC77285.1 hypothetical protein PLESTF_001915400 [Pleodorina starrii]
MMSLTKPVKNMLKIEKCHLWRCGRVSGVGQVSVLACRGVMKSQRRIAGCNRTDVDVKLSAEPVICAPVGNNLSRRLAAATLTCTVLGLSTQEAGRAENGPLPRACAAREYEGSEPPGVVPYTDPAGRFRLVRPCGWTTVTSLLPGSSVLASFYNPEEPGAETLAVYQAPAPAPVLETRQLGSAQDVAAGLANVAPNGLVIEARGLSHGGRDYILAHVQFGGNTAGMFGAAREFRVITVAGDVQYTLRLTTTRYRYLAFSQVRELMSRVAETFEVLA